MKRSPLQVQGCAESITRRGYRWLKRGLLYPAVPNPGIGKHPSFATANACTFGAHDEMFVVEIQIPPKCPCIFDTCGDLRDFQPITRRLALKNIDGPLCAEQPIVSRPNSQNIAIDGYRIAKLVILLAIRRCNGPDIKDASPRDVLKNFSRATTPEGAADCKPCTVRGHREAIPVVERCSSITLLVHQFALRTRHTTQHGEQGAAVKIANYSHL